MSLYNTNVRQWQTNGNRPGLSNVISSVASTNSVLSLALPAPLGAPPGWHSEIVESNSPVPIETRFEQVNTNTNNAIVNQYDNGYYTENTYSTSQVQPNIIRNNNQFINTAIVNKQQQFVDQGLIQQQRYIDNGAIHRQQTFLTEQQQQDLIRRVEHQNPPPLVVHKQLPNNLVTYKQNISVRYLKPPTPPQPGPLIIREVRPPPPPPQSPIQIRQRPPPPPSPAPLVLRERPPPLPPQTPAQVVEKLLPPPPPAPRRVIIERFPECPPKPADVIIERWLPYKQTGERRVLVERAAAPYIAPREPNLLILHSSPQTRIHKEYINQGVVRVDPHSYLQRYGNELNTSYTHSYLVDEAVRAVPPPSIASSDHHRYQYDNYSSYLDRYQRAPSPYLSNSWDRTRYETSIPRSSSYHYDYSTYDSPYSYSSGSSHRYGLQSSRSYDDYYRNQGGYRTMTDVTPSWNRHCDSSPYGRYSSYPSSYNRSSSYYPEKTIRVSSDNEFHNVLSDLTHGRIPRELH